MIFKKKEKKNNLYELYFRITFKKNIFLNMFFGII